MASPPVWIRHITPPGDTPEPAPPFRDAHAIALECELPRAADAGAHARRFIRTHLGAQLSDQALIDATLIAAELVNNAVLHGQGRITLRASLRPQTVRVEVIDQGSGTAPAIRERAGHWDDGGRGLRIVAALATRWGIFEGTTHVWADLPAA